MGRPKKKPNVVEQEMFYHASSTPVEKDGELYANESTDEALRYLSETEAGHDEVYLYEIKLVGKFKVSYNLEPVSF